MLDFLIKLQTVDRRWLYLALGIVCTVPFLINIPLNMYISPETQSFYNTIEQVNKDPQNKDKVVLVDIPWEPPNVGELKGQTEALFEHLLRNRQKFVIISMEGQPTSPRMASSILDDLLKRKEFRDRKYGVDWAQYGVSKGFYLGMLQMAKDFNSLYPKDLRGNATTDAKALPIMQALQAKPGFPSADNISLICCIAYTPWEDWIWYVHETYKTPVVMGCAGISSTTLYRYMPSKQLEGLLVGTRGGAEYDALLYPNDVSKRKNYGTKLMVPLSYGHMVIIVAVVLGNIGFFAARRRGGR